MNENFDLSVDVVLPVIQRRAENLQSIIDNLESRISRLPQGELYASQSHGTRQWQYYKDGLKRYLPKSKSALIEGLAQKKYLVLLLEQLKKQRDVLDRLILDYHPEQIHAVYESLEGKLRNFVSPLFPSSGDFESAWRSVSYRGKGLDGANLVTCSGVQVRSKSEMIIADALYAACVPFRYEFPCRLNWLDEDGKNRRLKIYPDFTCLNVRTRREFIWEHFGMMDDAGYSQDTVGKLESYENSGFVFGENLIYTMETRSRPLDSKKVQRMIARYLL